MTTNERSVLKIQTFFKVKAPPQEPALQRFQTILIRFRRVSTVRVCLGGLRP